MMEIDIAVGSGLTITCDRDVLVSRLAAVSRVVSSRGAVQVLSGVLLNARDGTRCRPLFPSRPWPCGHPRTPPG